MIGSPLLAWWFAHAAFWVLLVLAALDRRWRTIVVVGALWIVGYSAASRMESLSLFFMPYVAILDIALVLIVLKRDIRFG